MDEKLESAASSMSRIFIPEVDEDKTPRLGMYLHDLEEAYEFYNTYARAAGFGIRRGSDKKKRGEVYWKQFMCAKQGQRVEKEGGDFVSQKRVPYTRENCRAEIVVKKITSGHWVVNKFVEEHTHVLSTPRKTHMFRSHRKITPAHKKLIDAFEENNIRPANQMGLLSTQAGGSGAVGFNEQDMRNHHRDKQNAKKGRDGKMLYEYFEYMKEMNPGFSYSIETDESNQIKHVFWADHLCRLSYIVFGDVVTFDTTYQTNKYDLIFGAFMGVNHHDQTVIFGSGFLSNESFDSFVWLFRRWLEVMPAGPPEVIVTDQDPAMRKAIKHVMPATRHRFCVWHIMQKLPSKLGGLAIHADGLMDAINKAVYNAVSMDHFEMEWANIRNQYNLKEDSWLEDMYTLREMWIPIFLRGMFFAGMSSSQRSESFNAFLKQFETHKCGLHDFMMRFERAITRQRYQELKAEHENLQTRPKLLTGLEMEEQMAGIYSRKIFHEFQVQFMAMVSSIPKLVKENASESIYDVWSMKNKCKTSERVIFNKDSKCANCSCKLFEFRGIPCSHIIVALKHEMIFTLPEHFILKRWTSHARDGTEYSKCLIVGNTTGGTSLIVRHGDLSYWGNMVSNEASMCSKTYEYARNVLTDLHKMCRQMNQLELGGEHTSSGKNKMVSDAVSEAVQLIEPPHATTKGRPKRLKSSREKAQKKDRLCRGCNQRGVSHDKRNCPALLNR